MDPALMNYLQSQQANQQQNPQGNAAYNPFDAGISRAISSAQESLGMTEKQQDKALRRSLLTFANNIAQQPKQRGFFNNFGAAARAMNPAILDYDNSEEQYLAQNNNLANQILGYQAANRKEQNALDQQNWMRGHAENQLAEQKRYHDMAMSLQKQKLGMQQQAAMQPQQSFEPSLVNGFGGKYIPFQSKKNFDDYSYDKSTLGKVLQEVKELESAYNDFREKYSGNKIDPMSPIAGIANPAKDFFGKFTNNKEFREETADRETLKSRLGKFVTTSERALKGGGVIGPKIIEIFKEQGIYPDIQKDTPETFESKLKMLMHELESGYKASKLSLQYKLQIDPYELGDFESNLRNNFQNQTPNVQQVNNGPFNATGGASAIDMNVQPLGQMQQVAPNANTQQNLQVNNSTKFVEMQDSAGDIFNIPSNRVNEAMEDGLRPISSYSMQE